jgi:DNA-binding transcriptional MerR regulator
MDRGMRIGDVAGLTGLSVKTIRFYEDEGYIPRAQRTDSGYRRFAAGDVRRLRLVGLMRRLGVGLNEVKALLDGSFDGECTAFAADLAALFEQQERAINDRIAELEELKSELSRLAHHVRHCECDPGQTLAGCDYCSILDAEGGENNGCKV